MAKLGFLCGQTIELRCPLCRRRRRIIWVRRLGRDGLALIIKAETLKMVEGKPLSVIDFRHFGQGERSWHLCVWGRDVPPDR
jgi:hypothetical protein